MEFIIREISKESPEELASVAKGCMAAVLETIPEFEGNEEKAKESLPNFTFEQMRDMIYADLHDPDKRIIVATVENILAGQALYSVKTDPEGKFYGFCFSRYVLPEYRLNGIASKLLEDALDWFEYKKAEYVIAQTHVANIPLQNLFQRFGFVISEPLSGPWEYFVLRKGLTQEERKISIFTSQ